MVIAVVIVIVILPMQACREGLMCVDGCSDHPVSGRTKRSWLDVASDSGEGAVYSHRTRSREPVGEHSVLLLCRLGVLIASHRGRSITKGSRA